MEFQIIYEDRQLIVCQKPAGIPVQSARAGTKDMVSMLKNYRKEHEQISGEPYIGVVHRLDQPVQGLLVFAKTKQAAASLSSQVGDGRMKKFYQAVVCTKAPVREGVLEDYLLKDGRTNTSRIVPEGTKGAKRARLSCRLLEQRGGYALVQVELMTGRHHQIRVQMAGAGMPLTGDRKYNEEEEAPLGTGVALAACRLVFTHPSTKKEMNFEMKPQGPAFDNFR